YSPGRSSVVAEIEMVRSGIVKIDRAFHQSQTQHLCVEIQVLLGLRSNRGHVMQAHYRFRHNLSPPRIAISRKSVGPRSQAALRHRSSSNASPAQSQLL